MIHHQTSCVTRRIQRRTTPSRRGAALVEFAFAGPVFLVLFFTAVEFSRVNMMRNTAEIAATEAARRGVLPGAKVNECREVARDELELIGIKDYQITISPAAISSSTESVTVTVTVPLSAQNGYFASGLFLNKRIVKSIELQSEQ